jgi:hypothetical protein
MIFLLIQSFLFLPGDMAIILGSHILFFLADLMILLVQLSCFLLAHLAISYFLVDPVILMGQPEIYLSTTGMVRARRHGHANGSEKNTSR